MQIDAQQSSECTHIAGYKAYHVLMNIHAIEMVGNEGRHTAAQQPELWHVIPFTDKSWHVWYHAKKRKFQLCIPARMLAWANGALHNDRQGECDVTGTYAMMFPSLA